MNKLKLLGIFLVFMCVSFIGHAQETDTNKPQSKNSSQIITIETATIRGNQELPTVLYLVPWQAPQINSLSETQTTDILKQEIELIDRSSFKRLIEFHQSL